MSQLNLYLDDLERITAVAKVHESVNRKFGIAPLCTMNVHDAHGNRLGSVEQDQQGKTVFRLSEIKR